MPRRLPFVVSSSNHERIATQPPKERALCLFLLEIGYYLVIGAWSLVIIFSSGPIGHRHFDSQNNQEKGEQKRPKLFLSCLDLPVSPPYIPLTFTSTDPNRFFISSGVILLRSDSSGRRIDTLSAPLPREGRIDRSPDLPSGPIIWTGLPFSSKGRRLSTLLEGLPAQPHVSFTSPWMSGKVSRF